MFGSPLDSEQAFDRMTRVTRTGVRRRRLAAILTAAAIAGAWAGPVARALGGDREPSAAARSLYVVRGGDTLWAIAERLAPGDDPRPLVDAISDANGVEPGALVPGQTLVIPAG
jgi:nucleoid-associated protein YgaU